VNDDAYPSNEMVSLVPRETSTVALPVSVEQALEEWKQYQELTTKLLNDSDYQKIGAKRFKKKSAWRKYARAFNITDRVTYEHIERDADGFPIWARIRVEAMATNGRTAEADHECHIGERCCPARTNDFCNKRNWKGHTCCKANCNQRLHWSHPGDLPATALTRAKNRAIADLIGAGEVSAEEMAERKDLNEEDGELRAMYQEGRPKRPEGMALEPDEVVAAPPAERPSMKEQFERQSSTPPSDDKKEAIAATNAWTKAKQPLSPLLNELFGGRGLGSLSDDECITLANTIYERLQTLDGERDDGV
jgi:hypothetical protein